MKFVLAAVVAVVMFTSTSMAQSVNFKYSYRGPVAVAPVAVAPVVPATAYSYGPYSAYGATSPFNRGNSGYGYVYTQKFGVAYAPVSALSPAYLAVPSYGYAPYGTSFNLGFRFGRNTYNPFGY